MDSVIQDLRYSLRTLARRPGFSALAVLTLAIGIGVNTVAFNAINALVLKPFRVADADRVGWIRFEGPGTSYGEASLHAYERLASAATSFDSIAAEGRLPVSLQTPAGAREAWSALVSVNYLETVGGRPEMGRLFTASDGSGSDLPVIVSHRFWKESLASASLAGLTLVINQRSFSVVGVLPDDFQGRGGLFAPDMWLPLERMDVLNVPPALRRGGEDWLLLFGHLREGVAREQAVAELAAISRSLPPDKVDPQRLKVAKFYPMDEGHPEVREMARFAWLALAVVGLVLLIACFNVAALLMTRASERQREIGVRSALGASRGRIVRQLMVEGVVLALVGGAATLVLASWSGSLLATFSLPAPIPQRLHLGVDRTLVGFTALLVLIAGVLPAIVPALQATGTNLLRSLRMESHLGGRPSRARNTFVALQIAGSTLFLALALLFVRSFLKHSAFDPGFDTGHTAVMQVTPSMYGYEPARARQMIEEVRARVANLSGVSSAGIVDRAPFFVGLPKSAEYTTDAADCAVTDCRRATVYAVAPGLFESLGIPLRSGRDFTPAEMASGTAVVVSDRLAAQLWPGEAPLGRTFRIGDGGRVVQVVGVAGDIRYRGGEATPILYRPLGENEWADGIAIVVRARQDPGELLGALQEQVRSVDRNLPVTIATMTERMKLPLWPARTAAGFFLICGLLALVLAAVGLFGVLYFTVTQRTREFGIRVALGASPRRVIGVVMREGLTLAVPGLLLGSAAAFAGARLAARALSGVSPADPLSFTATIAIQLIVVLAASALPAYRATRSDPMLALRAE